MLLYDITNDDRIMKQVLKEVAFVFTFVCFFFRPKFCEIRKLSKILMKQLLFFDLRHNKSFVSFETLSSLKNIYTSSYFMLDLNTVQSFFKEKIVVRRVLLFFL